MKESQDRGRREDQHRRRDYRQNLPSARIAAKVQQEQVATVGGVQPPSLPLTRVRPHRLRNISLGVLLARFGCFTAAFNALVPDRSLNTIEAVARRLGVPVLAAVPEGELKQCT